jgi:hypothetical protein
MSSLRALGAVFVVNLVFGLPAYFIAFLFAYGFRDSVVTENHAEFVLVIATFASFCGLVQRSVPSPRHPWSARRAGFGVAASLSLNSAVVGVGSIVSATHKAENSVSADFSHSTDVLVATCLFLAAIGFARLAQRISPYARPRSTRS